MADDTTRWDRVNEKPADKPAFSARQSTDSFRQAAQAGEGGTGAARRSSRRHHHHHHHSRARSAKIWYTIGVVVLSLLTVILAWQLFGT